MSLNAEQEQHANKKIKDVSFFAHHTLSDSADINLNCLLALQGLINNDRGSFYNTETHEEIPISQALNMGLIVGELVSATDKQEVFRSALVASRISTDTALVSVINPITGEARREGFRPLMQSSGLVKES